MKKLAVILAVVSLLVLAQASQAVDLKAGWYANIRGVNIYTYDIHDQPQLVGGGYFYQTPLGQYGPFVVTDGPYHEAFGRYISVPTDVTNVGPNQNLTVPLMMGLSAGTKIAFLELSWQTNYDPTQMYLDLWHTRQDGTSELLWSQKQPGAHGDADYTAYDTIIEGPFYFRVNVVPEPSCAAGLVFGMLALVPLAKIRRA